MALVTIDKEFGVRAPLSKFGNRTVLASETHYCPLQNMTWDAKHRSELAFATQQTERGLDICLATSLATRSLHYTHRARVWCGILPRHASLRPENTCPKKSEPSSHHHSVLDISPLGNRCQHKAATNTGSHTGKTAATRGGVGCDASGKDARDECACKRNLLPHICPLVHFPKTFPFHPCNSTRTLHTACFETNPPLSPPAGYAIHPLPSLAASASGSTHCQNKLLHISLQFASVCVCVLVRKKIISRCVSFPSLRAHTRVLRNGGRSIF